MSEMEKEFGHCEIKWEVENLSLAACRSYWEIVSPDFFVRGATPTKWRMALRPESEEPDPFIIFSLGRLECNHIFQQVVVSGFLFIEIGKHFFTACPVFESLCDINSQFEMRSVKLSCLLEKLDVFLPDVICFRCELLVYIDNNRGIVSQFQDSNAERLSEALCELYVNGHEYDISLRMKLQTIRAHKCILYSRSEFFAEEIDKNPDGKVIDIIVVDDFNALKKVMAFIYTGKLEYILKVPSINVLMLAEAFQLRDVVHYYTPDELPLYTTICAEDFSFTWTIKNAFGIDDHVESPILMIERMDTTCILTLHTKDSRNKEYAAFFAEIFGGKISKDSYFEFAVKSNNCYFCSSRTQRTINGEEICEYSKLIKRSILRQYVESGDLTVAFKLRVATGEHKYAIGNGRNLCINSSQQHCNNLCTEMKIMYTESLLSDVIIRSKTGRFKANKCILAVRAPTIYDMLAGSNCFLLDIEDEVLDELLHFLYCGTFRDEKPAVRILSKVFETEQKLNIQCLTLSSFADLIINYKKNT